MSADEPIRIRPKLRSDTKAAASLMQLNDDCLLEILNYLDNEGLCQLNDVCTRMRSIAQQTFRKRYKEKVFKLWKYDEWAVYQVLCQSTFRRVLCKFGHLITSLFGFKWSFSQEHNRAINKYCTNLTDLKLLNSNIDCCDVSKVLFERLKRLDVRSCEFNGNASMLFTNCPKLEWLNISWSFHTNIIATKFPNLQELKFTPLSRQRFEGFQQFLSQNPQLQRLTTRITEDTRYLPAIGELATNLEQLEITCYHSLQISDYLPISQLTKLKKLHVYEPTLSGTNTVAPLMSAFLKENMALEHLHIDLYKIDSDAIKTITKFKALKILELFKIDRLADNLVVSLANGLPLLTKLHLQFSWCCLQEDVDPVNMTLWRRESIWIRLNYLTFWIWTSIILAMKSCWKRLQIA